MDLMRNDSTSPRIDLCTLVSNGSLLLFLSGFSFGWDKLIPCMYIDILKTGSKCPKLTKNRKTKPQMTQLCHLCISYPKSAHTPPSTGPWVISAAPDMYSYNVAACTPEKFRMSIPDSGSYILLLMKNRLLHVGFRH
jgi:hypothetical protein